MINLIVSRNSRICSCMFATFKINKIVEELLADIFNVETMEKSINKDEHKELPIEIKEDINNLYNYISMASNLINELKKKEIFKNIFLEQGNSTKKKSEHLEILFEINRLDPQNLINNKKELECKQDISKESKLNLEEIDIILKSIEKGNSSFEIKLAISIKKEIDMNSIISEFEKNFSNINKFLTIINQDLLGDLFITGCSNFIIPNKKYKLTNAIEDYLQNPSFNKDFIENFNNPKMRGFIITIDDKNNPINDLRLIKTQENYAIFIQSLIRIKGLSIEQLIQKNLTFFNNIIKS